MKSGDFQIIPMKSGDLLLPRLISSFLLVGLLRGLGSLALHNLGGGGLDDAHSHGLPHVTDSEPSERREVSEGLDTHGLAGGQLDDGRVTRLDELRVVLNGLTGTAVNLLLDLSELAGDVGGVTVQDWAVAVADLARMVEDDHLGGKVRHPGGGLVLAVGGHVASLDVLHGDVLDVETNVVSRHGLGERLVVHLHRLDLSGQLVGGEGDDHAGLDDAGLNTTHGNCANTSDLVDILQGKPERLVSGSGWRNDSVKSLQESHAAGLSLLPLHVPALVPGHLLGGVDHVVAVPPGDGDEGNSGGGVPDLLDEAGDLLADLLKPGLAVGRLSGVHLVGGHDELLHPEGVGQQGVLSGLTVLGDASLELASSGGDDEHSAVSLGGTGDHVLDEVTMSGSVDDGDIVLRGLELPESDVDGDTPLTLSLQFVQHPGVLEGALAGLLGLLLELLDGSLVDTSALVDQVTSGGGLAGVDVSNDNNVDVDLFLTHGESSKTLRRFSCRSESSNISLVVLDK